VLYEAQRQRTIAGMYNTQQLPEQECQALAFQNGYPRLFKLCMRKGLPYPAINNMGEVIADESWWREMQITKAEAEALEAN
jgi:tRNA (guanosine-2'-O-)-methyltransferase